MIGDVFRKDFDDDDGDGVFARVLQSKENDEGVYGRRATEMMMMIEMIITVMVMKMGED